MKLKSVLAASIFLLFINQSILAKPPYNISLAKNAVTQYYLSGEYQTDVEKVVGKAEHYLLKSIKENKQHLHPQKLAMVLDIDDTSLSNFHWNRINDFGGTEETIHASYLEANAPAIEPVLKLYNIAIHNGVSIFFISFRPEDVRSSTITNLQKAGYAGWTELFLPNKEEIKLPPAIFKTQIRKALTERGYRIVLNMGDQDSDLVGGYAEHIEKIPNPLYLNTMPNT